MLYAAFFSNQVESLVAAVSYHLISKICSLDIIFSRSAEWKVGLPSKTGWYFTLFCKSSFIDCKFCLFINYLPFSINKKWIFSGL